MYKMLDRFSKIHPQILCALIDLNLSHLLPPGDLEKLNEALNVLQPINLVVEALSKKDANLLTSEEVFQFLFKVYNDEFLKEMLTALKSLLHQ